MPGKMDFKTIALVIGIVAVLFLAFYAAPQRQASNGGLSLTEGKRLELVAEHCSFACGNQEYCQSANPVFLSSPNCVEVCNSAALASKGINTVSCKWDCTVKPENVVATPEDAVCNYSGKAYSSAAGNTTGGWVAR